MVGGDGDVAGEVFLVSLSPSQGGAGRALLTPCSGLPGFGTLSIFWWRLCPQSRSRRWTSGAAALIPPPHPSHWDALDPLASFHPPH